MNHGLDRHWMDMALALAGQAVGRSSPNPPVGAVLVRQNVLVGQGATQPPGGDHAEVVALKQAGDAAFGATLYVTLEPCSFHGRTPACSLAIRRAGVARVVVATQDRHPQVSGQGLAQLRQGAIQVDLMPEAAPQAHSLLHPFFRSLGSYGPARPEYVAKAALTLDGYLASKKGSSQWISHDFSRAVVHRLRSLADAILVGVKTVRQDNPRLTVRCSPYLQQNGNYYYPGGIPQRDALLRHALTLGLPWPQSHIPRRLILDKNLDTPHNSYLVQSARELPTTLFYNRKREKGLRPRLRKLERAGVEVLSLAPKGKGLDLAELHQRLLEMGVLRVLVEGGGAVHASLWRQGIYDRFFLFQGNRLLGGSDGISFLPGAGWRDMTKATGLANYHVLTLPSLRVDDDSVQNQSDDWNTLHIGASGYVYGIS